MQVNNKSEPCNSELAGIFDYTGGVRSVFFSPDGSALASVFEKVAPYQLAAPADVTGTIYAVDGTLVRTLSLGHKPIGSYQNRTRAAYWDGKNGVGEPVVSGVYFYTLSAGNFTATRKMLIRK